MWDQSLKRTISEDFDRIRLYSDTSLSYLFQVPSHTGACSWFRLSTTASPRTSIHRRPPPSSHPISFTASPTRPPTTVLPPAATALLPEFEVGFAVMLKSILLLLLSNRYRLCVYMLKSNLKMGFSGCLYVEIDLLRFFTAV
ncbi:hypothetical protein LXL04_001974 [Taraxacum kok-saghyz]